MKKVFISFDFNNDEFLRYALVGQSKKNQSPFEIIDRSLKNHLVGDWKAKVRSRIDKTDIVIVLCGEKTHEANGVAIELLITKDLQKPYFLLNGYAGKICTKPASATEADKIYKWTWENLEKLIKGNR